MFKIAVICGGPSPERGISLNSARSLLDHLSDEVTEIIPLYVDLKKQFHSLTPSQLYSNTPSDFDFKLKDPLSADDLLRFLQSVDIVFPVIHGHFGEDGTLQELLENWKIPFVGHSSASCKAMYPKDVAASFLKKWGFLTLDGLILTEDNLSQIDEIIKQKKWNRFVIKPVLGGSSIGVGSFSSSNEAKEFAQKLFQKGHHKLLVEPFCKGIEFTVVVLKGKALQPTEIEISYENHEIFDYRKKYLPTTTCVYHTPPRFAPHLIQEIQKGAEKLFELFEMRDFIRIDGWLLENNEICFTDINPISGLEQNSFFFRQAAIAGMTHKQALHAVLESAAERYNLSTIKKEENIHSKKPVYVLFGGKNAERQVSLMSGTNVWLKLLKSKHFQPEPFFFDPEGSVWKVPYPTILNHTVEEIYHVCKQAEKKNCMSLKDFTLHAKVNKAFVFIALHGGMGEDGTLQTLLEAESVMHNGSDSFASKLCMDKFETGKIISKLNHPDIISLPKKRFKLKEQLNWNQITEELSSNELIVKPAADGCSAGIVLLKSKEDFDKYLSFARAHVVYIAPGTFINQKGLIEMPSNPDCEYLLEPYIETDTLTIENNSLKHTPKKGFLELTVGVLEQRGHYKSLNPSITIAEGAVLSLEEKFQGGTGVNITPPPTQIISDAATKKIKALIEESAKALQIKNYARIDIFFNIYSEKIIVIEANTLPGLTPSTVIYHQALAENPPLSPTAFLEHIINSKI